MDKDIHEDGNLKDDLPREKFSFRYTTRGIWLFIIIISMISILGTFFMKSFGTDFYGRVTKEEFYSNEFRNEIMNINSRNGYNYNNVNLLDFYIRSYGMSNYEFTREFKEKYPNIVAVRNNISGEIVRTFNVDELDYYRDDYNDGSYSFNIDVTEEPNYVLKNKSNLNYGDNVNPQDIKIKSNEIAVKGIYENGKVTFNNTNANENVKEESNNKLFETALKNATVDYFYYNNDGNEYLNYVQQNNDKVNFCFILDLNSNVVTNLENNYYTQEMLIPSIVTIFMLSMFIVAIFGTVTNYKKAKQVEFYEGISKFPIEIVWVLWLLLLAGVGLFTNEFRISPDITGTVIIGAGQFIFTFFSSIALVYLIFGIKSIYNDGMKSFLIQESITVKICKWFINLFKRFYHKVKNYFARILDNLEILNKRHITILFISLIIGGGVVISITTYNSTFLIILWIIFITIAFNYAKKYYEDLINISETSKLISKGNYDIKIDENTTNFKDIAHSFNTIGDNLNEAVDKAIKSERLKSELITNVSHDLKTPLTSIINYSELIVDEKSDFEKQKEYAKVINEKSLKLKKLIEDLFEVSKVTSNNIELHIEEIDFKQLVNQIVGEWLDKFEEKKLDINISITDKPVSLQLDGNKTSRVLDNLFSNIYKYTLEGTRVYIDLDKNNTTTLTIKNISKYALNISADELMERFTRGDSSRTTEGSGLGLSIASSLVDAQGGSFEIEIDGDLFKTIIEF
ncbi:Signal transduction histidine kinase [Anaerosphaera aminiphila DSM 21120]|uniref:histidine kinase n=1 Tax=Anaerosphaera aminiphila DSM 21120 TaxID=1120995 RepID=A0A1M5NSK6_9FIRM|nr:HAMP domain-containing sensor histidine kinase [Anaerosphaera aminiphila]SHG92179.1 Signal transduction histidine kinase [Anaerosphaera aminiphila DSM 21120]